MTEPAYQGPSIVGSVRVRMSGERQYLPLSETVSWAGWPEDLDVPVPPIWASSGLDHAGVMTVRRHG